MRRTEWNNENRLNNLCRYKQAVGLWLYNNRSSLYGNSKKGDVTMKRILGFGLLLIALVAACAPAAEQPEDNQQRGASVTVYRAPT